MTSSPDILFMAAQEAEKNGNWSRAIEAYSQALEQRPNFLEAHHNLALAFRHLEQTDHSLIHAKAAALLAPEHPTVQFSLGVALEHTGEIDSSVAAYLKAVELRPNYIAALSNLGRLLEVHGRIPESIQILERAIALAPTVVAVRLNLGNSYLLGGFPEKCVELLNGILTDENELSDTSKALALNSLGVATHIQSNRQKAIEFFRKSIQCLPNFAEAHENLAQTLLFEEQYSEAWLEYEWRWLNESNKQIKRQYGEALWDGEQLSDKTLLIHAEQGFGDIIQFSRFIDLIDKQNSKIVLFCPESLCTLLSGLHGIDEVSPLGTEPPEFNYHIPLLSLPRLINIQRNNIPQKPYLQPQGTPPSFEIEFNAKKLNIGLTWAGMPRHEFDPHRNRTCPLGALESVVSIPNCQFYSLQTGPQAQQLRQSNFDNAIIDLSPHLTTFNSTAHVVNQLDLILTIDTAMAHLAGAMGKRVWILLSKSADWRWQDENQNNPWYPSARIFRQDKPGNWEHPLNMVGQEIAKLIP